MQEGASLESCEAFSVSVWEFFFTVLFGCLGRVARSVAAVLARACHGPARLRQLVAAGDVQTFAIKLSRPKRRTHITRLNTLNDATWLLE